MSARRALPAKLDASGDLSTLADQDRSRWDAARVAEGLALLERSARGDDVSPYHLEAAIAAEHACASTLAQTSWALIEDCDRLVSYPFYWAALGELELRSGDAEGAAKHLRAAKVVARSEPSGALWTSGSRRPNAAAAVDSCAAAGKGDPWLLVLLTA